MLTETLSGGSLSHQVINRMFADGRITETDRAFIVSLYLGVLERLVFLDYNIAAFSDTAPDKIKPVIKNILRLSLYQLFFMDGVPDRAVLSEALKLVQLRKMPQLKGYVNGVLRTAQRNGPVKGAPAYADLSVPEWIYEKALSDLGKERADEFFAAALKKDEGLYAFVNTRLADKESVLKELEAEGAQAQAEGDILNIKFSGALEELGAFKKGYIYIQSPNSMKAAQEALKWYKGPEDPLIIDTCASPGGKSVNLSLAFPEGTVISRDKSAEKIRLIEQNIKRLKLSNINVQVKDACTAEKEDSQSADIVMVDAPCSGLGVISGKPDIKYRLKKTDIDELSKLQREILRVSSACVKAGGILIYSTCTFTEEENGENARRFCEECGFKLLSSTQYTMYKERADGFYVSAFAKN